MYTHHRHMTGKSDTKMYVTFVYAFIGLFLVKAGMPDLSKLLIYANFEIILWLLGSTQIN